MTSNNFKIWWDDENQIARAWAKGVITEEMATALLNQTIKIAEIHGDNINWLVEQFEIKTPNAKARQILTKAVGHRSIKKYALVGGSTFIRTMSNFILTIARQKNAKHFATKKEAMTWIKGK
jgi:hypothetical protein